MVQLNRPMVRMSGLLGLRRFFRFWQKRLIRFSVLETESEMIKVEGKTVKFLVVLMYE